MMGEEGRLSPGDAGLLPGSTGQGSKDRLQFGSGFHGHVMQANHCPSVDLSKTHTKDAYKSTKENLTSS